MFNDNWGLFGRFFKKGNIHKQRYTHKKQVQKSNVIGNSSKLIHLLFLIFSLKALAIISDIIPHINLTIKERAVGCPGDTIQFLNYGYVEYIKTVLGFLNIDSSLVDWSKYEYWNPYED